MVNGQELKVKTKRNIFQNLENLIFFAPQPPRGGGAKILPNNMLGETIIKRGWQKGWKCIFFPQLVKSINIFSPIDLKYKKIAKKG